MYESNITSLNTTNILWFINILLVLSLASCYAIFNIFLFLSVLVPMTSFSRYKLPARQTKVVDESQLLLKTGSPWCGDLRNDVTSSKSCSKGRDVVDDSQGVLVFFFVCVCVFLLLLYAFFLVS